MEAKEEKKNKRIALFIALGVQLGLFIAFLLIVAWREPDPPIPEYGIMVDFGTSDQGSGADPVPNSSPDPTPSPEPEVVPEPSPEPEVEPTPQNVEEAEPITEPVSEVESPDVVEEQPEPTPQPEPEPEPEPVEEEPKPTVNPNALMGPRNNATGGSSQGNDENAAGDKGQTDGDRSDIYEGPSGGGNGDGLSVPGWEWDRKPAEPGEITASSGYVRFKIESDAYGNIVKVERVSGTLSPGDERKLRNAIFSGKLRPEGGKTTTKGGVGYFTWRIKESG